MSRTSLLAAIRNRVFGGYDALEQPRRRKHSRSSTRSADADANPRERSKLMETSRDQARNFAVLAWAIRKHLDYVTRFSFQARTESQPVNEAVEKWMTERTKARRFDAAGRHGLRRFLRLAEASRTRDGDVFPLKIAAAAGSPYRGAIAGIEGDRVRNPDSRSDGEKWVNGVLVGAYGQSLKYAIHNRGGGGTGWEHWKNVSASSLWPLGYYQRLDQVRGVSPLTSALNSFRDVYEGADLAMAKVKLSQIFGVAIMRDGDDALPTGVSGETEEGEEEELPTIPFNKGPWAFDFAPGERAEVIESKSPAAEVVNFFRLVLQVGLKSLDIPFCFFDESFTNYYGQRAAEIAYRESCVEKIADLVEFLDDWTRWAMAIDVADGRLVLPRGYSVVDFPFEWVPAGKPWWDPAKEIKGRTDAIAKGLDTPQRACRETGSDYFTNIDDIAAAQEYAERKGVKIDFTGAAKLAAKPPEPASNV